MYGILPANPQALPHALAEYGNLRVPGATQIEITTLFHGTVKCKYMFGFYLETKRKLLNQFVMYIKLFTDTVDSEVNVFLNCYIFSLPEVMAILVGIQANWNEGKQ